MIDICHQIETLNPVGRGTHGFVGIVTYRLCTSGHIAGFVCIALLSDIIVTLRIIIIAGAFGKTVITVFKRIYTCIITLNIAGITFTLAPDA